MKLFLGILLFVLIIVSARFRKFAAVAVLVGITVVLLVWQYQEYARDSVKSKILPVELVLQHISIKPSTNSDDYEMTGRVINNSERYTLNGLLLNVIAKDCRDNEPIDCLVVSEQKENVYITIPPRQARDFRKNIYLYSHQTIKDNLVWDYSIQYVTAE